ncbi:MAG TPA: tetratricopeptide repeat protein [Candidatus Binataceae bacterium]|nr:tetratricopeptide repeat protein [Candidatus Binataceae bacterium]
MAADDSEGFRTRFEPILARAGGGDWRVGTGLTALLIATALVFARSLGNGFVYDDGNLIVSNPMVGNWPFIARSLFKDEWWFLDPGHLPQSSYYRPLQPVWFGINFQLFGLNQIGWHAAMIVLHLIAVWLAFRVTLLLTRDGWASLLAAMLFALMPAHGESVTWIAAAPYLLSAALQLAAFDFYLRNRETGWQPLSLVLSMLLYGGALMSHDGAPIYVFLFAIYGAIFPLQSDTTEIDNGASNRMSGAIAAAWPYAIETAAFLTVRYVVLGFLSRPFPNRHLTAMETVLTIPRALCDYAMLLVVPWMAGPQHRLDPVESFASANFFLPVAALAALSAAAWILLRQHPHRRLYKFCVAWTLIALAPTLNLSALFEGTLLHDRYLYLPAFGFCVMAADLAAGYAHRGDRNARAVAIAAVAIAVCYAAFLVPVQYNWHDDITLFSRCAAETPDVELFHNRLGMALKSKGNLPGARNEFETAVKLNPNASGSVLYDLALVYEALGEKKEAADTMAEGLRRIAYPPASGYAQLALVADAAGDTNGAEEALKRTAELPDGAETAMMARAQLRLIHGDNKGAGELLDELLRHDPDNAEALASLGMALAAEHRLDEALLALHRAASLRPQAPAFHYLIALTLHIQGRENEAHTECAIALAEAPNDPKTRALMDAIKRGTAASH